MTAAEQNFHALHDKWAFWLRTTNNRTEDWNNSQAKCYSFKTIEDFWCLINSIINPFQLNTSVDYSVFRDKIKPDYDDPQLENGGRLIIKYEQSDLKHGPCFDTYVAVCAILIGESLTVQHGKLAAGIRLVIKRSSLKMEVWCFTAEESKIRPFALDMKKMVEEANLGVQLTYEFKSFKSNCSFTL